jgi:hypothetical protein
MEDSDCIVILAVPSGSLVNPDVKLFELSPGLQRQFLQVIAHEQAAALVSETLTGSRVPAVARHCHELGLTCPAKGCVDLSVFVLAPLPAAIAPNLMDDQNQVPANA